MSEQELIDMIKGLSAPPFYINVFNIENSCGEQEIRDFYSPINITKVIQNTKKQGNFDVEFMSKGEAIKFVAKGNGV